MDQRLQKRLDKIETQIDALRAAEAIFLELEANRKVLFAQLYLKAEGKNVAEKEAMAFSSKDWIDFIRAHTEAEVALNYERRWYELRMKAFDSEYLTYKIEDQAIQRQKRGL